MVEGGVMVVKGREDEVESRVIGFFSFGIHDLG